jgi:hypothetical protein
MDAINTEVPHGNYLVWHLLEHMRIVQWDILEFILDPVHESPEFPGGLWPEPGRQGTPADWERAVGGFRAGLQSLEKLVLDPATDFFGPIPHARDYTVFREILLAADHNAFHIGELVSVRRILNLNPVKEY